ncbi:MAG TPA: hypothetical protein VKZ75_09060, partial [Cyclobacteriaceae bacterium]|nr:hypothetical protein [Cyclobacteriaceae bacterium]
HKEMFHYALGSILLLEASKINPEQVLPLLSINEAFEACFKLFADIGIHDHQSHSSISEMNANNSIKANVGVALLTLPYYPILHNYCHLDDDSRLWLLQNATQSTLGVLYANGARLYRRQNKIPFAHFEEYKQSAFLLNAPKLGFMFNLWLALSQTFKSPRLVQLCKEAAMAFSLSCQLSNDLANFKDWIKRHSGKGKVTFWDTNNFIALCIARASQDSNILSKPLSPETILVLLNDSGAENDIANFVCKNQITTNHIVGELPLDPGHRLMLMSYIQWLLEDTDISYEK